MASDLNDEIDKLMADVPESEWAKLPHDLSSARKAARSDADAAAIAWAQDRIAELQAALDHIHMHAVPGEAGWIMVPFTEWVQAYTRVGFPTAEQK